MKTVLITGCSSGFGKDLVTQYLESGWKVIATLRKSGQRTQLFSADLKKYPTLLELFELDVTQESNRLKLAEHLRTYHASRLDCLVNNAGYGVFGAFEEVSETQLRHQFEVNFFGLSLITQQLLPYLREAQGRIINISSVLGYLPMPMASVYVASKFAVEGLTEALHFELKSVGVQVALVEPGRFKTDFKQNMNWGEKIQGSLYQVQTENYRGTRENTSTNQGGDPANVIRRIVKLSNMKKMPLHNPCGPDAKSARLFLKWTPDWLSSRTLSFAYDRAYLKKK